MKLSNKPIGINCTVNDDGVVLPAEGFEGPYTQEGEFRGNCKFIYVSARGTEPAYVIVPNKTSEEIALEKSSDTLRYSTELWEGNVLVQVWMEWRRVSDGGDVHYADAHWNSSPNFPVNGSDAILRTFLPLLDYPLPQNVGSPDGRVDAPSPGLGDLYATANNVFAPVGDFTSESFITALASAFNGEASSGTVFVRDKCVRLEQFYVSGAWVSDPTDFFDNLSDCTLTDGALTGLTYDDGGIIYEGYYVFKTRPAKGVLYLKF